MHEAEVIVLEASHRLARAAGWREAPQALGFEDAVDRIPAQMRQEVGDDEGQIIEREAGGTAQGADHRPLLLAGLPRQPVRTAGAVPAVLRSALAPLADGLGGDAIALGQRARRLSRAGDLGTDGRRGTGVGVDRKHQAAPLARGARSSPSKCQAYSSTAQRT